MKEVEEVKACVVDYGSFQSLAEKLAERYSDVYYYAPFEQEFLNVETYVKGDGMRNVVRLHELLQPSVMQEIDLWIFPDIGYGGLQKYLEAQGKAVWGSRDGTQLELLRTQFLTVLSRLGLPVVKSKTIRGISSLRDYLHENSDQWVKINRFRENMETWHHTDNESSEPVLQQLHCRFGPLSEKIVFVVQDNIESDAEIGYDGWCIDGEFPAESFQGYEKKNQLYLGSKLAWGKLPEAVRYINEAFAPVLKGYGYRNFFATEIRLKDGQPFFIDPTMRMPGQTGEQLLETCDNLSEVIWKGANGEIVSPKFNADFAAEATIHYKGESKGWKTIRSPEELRRWFKFYHYCEVGGYIHFPPRDNDELGVVLGTGNYVEDAVHKVKENFEVLEGEPVQIDFGGFIDLISEINDAEEQGVEFSEQEMPTPQAVLQDQDQ